MIQPTKDLEVGFYAKKQIFCKDRLISWAHGGRFQIGLKLAGRFAGRRMLDYGFGDGTFLDMVVNGPNRPRVAVGAEIDAALVEHGRKRFAREAALSFVHINDLHRPEHAGAYDAIVCMEVLEHVVEWTPVLDLFERILAPGGELLISVPVETGLPVLVKQTVRQIAGWRGLGDYPGTSPYTLNDYWASLFAGSEQHLTRPVHRHPDGSTFHDHKGFNWMRLRETLRRRFELQQVVGSPLVWLTPHLSSQTWFLACKRP